MTFALISIFYAPLGKCAPSAAAKRSRSLTRSMQPKPQIGQLADRTRTHRKEQPMLDIILLALGLGFFALSIAYAFGCDLL
jgi:hypothetical protein